MELYHGSNIEVTQPLALAGRRNLDFGRGFYTTRHKSQALVTKNPTIRSASVTKRP